MYTDPRATVAWTRDPVMEVSIYAPLFLSLPFRHARRDATRHAADTLPLLAPLETPRANPLTLSHPPSHAARKQTDLSCKTFLGKGTGEEFQLKFTDGYVVIQPYEELLPS